MKQLVNFRLSHKALSALAALEKKLQISKTSIVEEALMAYAKKKLANQNLLEFSGCLSESEADALLSVIQSSRHNKNNDIDL